MATTFTITDFADLQAAIKAIDVGGSASASNTTYTFNFALSGTNTVALTQQLAAINLASNSTLTVEGNGATLDGQHQYNGLFAYAGGVTIKNLTIANAKAIGGAGGSGITGGGGGAGLGGGLFVAQNANVTLSNVGFTGDSATGGAGGAAGLQGYGGGGGLEGGAGGNGVLAGHSGGGGGIGLSASGGSGSSGNGGAGIVPGTAPAALAKTGGVGGGSAGGGGGGRYSGGGGVPVSGSAYNGGYGGGGGFGAGGFGGGGGADMGGGFGGGAGGKAGQYKLGGFGGGSGTGTGGGGGLGAGGDIFVQQGGILVIEGGSLGLGGVTGGAGVTGSQSGRGFGSTLFIQGTQTVTLAAAAGQVLTIAGEIADQSGSYLSAGLAVPLGNSADNTPYAGVGSLTIEGPGTVQLAGANHYTGGTTVTGNGTLSIAADGNLGLGGTLALGAGTALAVTGGGTLTHPITLSGAAAIDVAAGQIVTDTGLIGNGGSAGTLKVGGAGTLVLNAANTYSGGTLLAGGALDLAAAGAAGSGAIAFQSASTLEFTAASTPGNEIDNFAPGDTIRIDQFAETSPSYANGVLTLQGTGGPVALDMPGHALSDFQFAVDAGGTTITYHTVGLTLTPLAVKTTSYTVGQVAPALPSDTLQVWGSPSGSVSLVNGNIVYTPASQPLNGLQRFTYQVSDGAGNQTPVGTAIIGGDGWYGLQGAGAGYTSIILGNGLHALTLQGSHNAVSVGSGLNLVFATDNGGDAVATGDGINLIVLGGGSDTVRTGSGMNEIVMNGGQDTVSTGAGPAALVLTTPANNELTLASPFAAPDQLIFSASGFGLPHGSQTFNFLNLAPQPLDPSLFTASGPATGSQPFAYDQANGTLSFDNQGSVLALAHFAPGTQITAASLFTTS